MPSLGKLTGRAGLMKAAANDGGKGKAVAAKFYSPSKNGTVPNELDPYEPKPATPSSYHGEREFAHANNNQAYAFPFKIPVTPEQEGKAITMIGQLLEDKKFKALDLLSMKLFGMPWKQAKMHPSLQDFV